MIEAIVQIGKDELTLNDILKSLTHVRGFGLSTSYCIIEIEHSSIEILFEYMNYGKFKIKYGKDDENTDWYEMEIFRPSNVIEFNKVSSKVIGVEPGFTRLSESVRAKSFPNQAVSSVVFQIANNVALNTDIKTTQGQATFIQPNVSDLQFIVNYLQPIAIDSGGQVPYLFTVDNGELVFKPPTLNLEPVNEYIIDPSIETKVKRFTTVNRGALSDFVSGSSCQAYSYDFVSSGLLSYSDTFSGVAAGGVNKELYSSEFGRIKTLPYDQKWMLTAHTKNLLARNRFTIACQAILEGSIKLEPDQINLFSLPKASGLMGEYSGKFWTMGIANVLKPRLFLSHVSLVSDSTLEGKEA